MSTTDRQRHALLRWIAGAPLGVLYVVSDVLYVLLYYIIRYRRKMVRENIRCSFPEKSRQECRAIERAFYHTLCDVFVEIFKLLNISDREMEERVQVTGAEMASDILRRGGNVFMLIGHCGCWEWFQQGVKHIDAPCRAAALYKHLSSHYFGSLMQQLRSRWGVEQVEMRQAVRTMLHWKTQGEPFIVGFIQDQRPTGMHVKGYTRFMNQRIGFVPGAEEIAQRVGATCLYLDVERPTRGHYRLTFRSLDDRSATDIHATDHSAANIPSTDERDSAERFPITVRYFEMLEETIRRQPELYLWSHNRWGKWTKLYGKVKTPPQDPSSRPFLKTLPQDPSSRPFPKTLPQDPSPRPFPRLPLRGGAD